LAGDCRSKTQSISCAGGGVPGHPRSHFSVHGERQPLWRVDSRYLSLHDQIAQSRDESTEVCEATYVEPETGIAHQTAVKKFKASPSSEELHQIHKELAVMFMASSRCHNVCKVFGWCHDETDGALCVVMKRYQENLSTKMQKMPEGRLPLVTVQKYARQIIIAVAELHAQNIVVADIKPHNLLIDEFDNCVVADFGISKVLSSNRDPSLADDGMHGTFNYMSPEAFDPATFGGITTQTDAWSFACCIIEMVTGKRPWENIVMSAICYKVTTTLETPTVPHALPTQAREALLRCFAHNPAARPSFNELFVAFQDDWDVPKSDFPHMQQAEGLQHEAAQLRARVRALEEEKVEWERERIDMRNALQDEACKLSRADLELQVVKDEAERAGGVVKQLKDQLQIVMESLRGGERCHNCVQSEVLRSQLEHQLGQCNEGLAQCIKQKDVAKEMLRQESEHSRQLSLQIQQMQALSKFVGWSLQAVIKETENAKLEVREIAVADKQREWAADAERMQGRVVRATPIKVPQLSTSDASLLDGDAGAYHMNTAHFTSTGSRSSEDWRGVVAMSSSSVDSGGTASSSLSSSRSHQSTVYSQASTPNPLSMPTPEIKLPLAPLCRWDPQQSAHC